VFSKTLIVIAISYLDRIKNTELLVCKSTTSLLYFSPTIPTKSGEGWWRCDAVSCTKHRTRDFDGRDIEKYGSSLCESKAVTESYEDDDEICNRCKTVWMEWAERDDWEYEMEREYVG